MTLEYVRLGPKQMKLVKADLGALFKDVDHVKSYRDPYVQDIHFSVYTKKQHTTTVAAPSGDSALGMVETFGEKAFNGFRYDEKKGRYVVILCEVTLANLPQYI